MQKTIDPFKYSLKVWMMTFLSAPILSILFLMQGHKREWTLTASISIYFLTVFVGALLSIPCWIILLISAKKIASLNLRQYVAKGLLLLLALLMAYGLLSYVFNGVFWDKEELAVGLLYLVTVSIFTLSFRLSS